MQFAYLKRTMSDYGELLGQIDEAPINDTAILKARTYLTYLFDNNLLVFQDSTEGWMLCYEKGTVSTGFTTVPQASELPSPEVVAIMPVKLKAPSWDQPGTILLRNSLEVRSLFLYSFLESSRSWLNKNPEALAELQAHMKHKKAG